MIRKPCPQKFDCTKMGAVPKRQCPNKKFCEEFISLGGLCHIPYEMKNTRGFARASTGELLGEEYLVVRSNKHGYATAQKLPYKLLEIYGVPALVVAWWVGRKFDDSPAQSAGWLAAEELPGQYLQWCHTAKAKTVSEYTEGIEAAEQVVIAFNKASYFFDVYQVYD